MWKLHFEIILSAVPIEVIFARTTLYGIGFMNFLIPLKPNYILSASNINLNVNISTIFGDRFTLICARNAWYADFRIFLCCIRFCNKSSSSSYKECQN